VRLAAHTLKSNAATLGAHELSERCRELEELAAAGPAAAERAAAGPLVDTVAEQLEQMLGDALDAELGRGSAHPRAHADPLGGPRASVIPPMRHGPTFGGRVSPLESVQRFGIGTPPAELELEEVG
jgi:hypothetical protein